jgi:hypothetical protein
LAGVILLAATAIAHGGAFFKYSQWERLPEEAREMYLAGAFDTIVGIADVESPGSLKRSYHYQDCLNKSDMNLQQLTQNVIAFARARPELQGTWTQIALGQYLNTLCGLPPDGSR